MLVLFFLAYYIELHPNSIKLPPALSTTHTQTTQRLGIKLGLKYQTQIQFPQNISADRIISFVASQRQSAETGGRHKLIPTLEKAARLIALAVRRSATAYY